jgi:RHS repeat-associated protein
MQRLAQASCQLIRDPIRNSDSIYGWPNNRTKYDYDALGRRASKTVTGSGTTSYLLDGDEEIAEYSGATVLRHYVTGPGVDDRVAHAEGSSITNPTKTYYHTNHQGSVMAMTDGSGNVTQRIGYDEYGNGSPSTGEQFGYTGRRYDPETGLYYYRARYYAPAIGRFLQVDPVGYKDNLNLYTYVRNDPLNLNDHNGRWPTPVHEEIIDKAFPGLSQSQRGVLKSASAWMDHKPSGQTRANSFQHSMKAPGEDPAKAKQDAQEFMNRKRADAQAAQGQAPNNTSQITDRALNDAGQAIHTATDGTSPAHVDANGNPRDWGGIPVTRGDWQAVSQHESEEASPTPAQLNSAVRAAQEQFIKVFGSGTVCVQATGSEAACK